MLPYTDIIYEKKGPIAYITLNRPDKLNALDPRPGQILEQWAQACREARDDDEVKVMVIKGAGRCFSAGYDQSDPDRISDQAWAIRDYLSGLDQLYFECLWDSPKASIAQVHSFCLAGGGHMACFCDITIASEDALFGYPPVRYASIGAHMLWPYLLGMKKAKEMLFTGNMMSAQEALSVGLVNRVVPRDKLDEEVTKLAQTIAKLPPMSVKLNKLAINEFYEVMGMRMALKYSGTLCSITYSASPQSIPGGLQDFCRVTREKGVRGAFAQMNAPFIEEDTIAHSQMARPDRKP